jgi:hypothetical protein
MTTPMYLPEMVSYDIAVIAMCVLGIPKGKFSKQMIKKYLVTEYLFITEGEFLF